MATKDSRAGSSVRKVASNEYRVSTHIAIDAPPEEVWETLTDWENLSTWSTSFVSLEGDFEEGGNVTVAFKMMGIERHHEHDLIDFQDGVQFAWSDPFLFGMVNRHRYRIERTGNGTTKFVHTDRVKGGPAVVLGSIAARMMKRRYGRFDLELKNQVENSREPR
jgi:uncharacterized protein YndB with AHSA1/START domain